MAEEAALANSRQSVFNQQAGIDECIADAVAVAHKLSLKLPALGATRRNARKLGNIK
jgi:hypothetical protein